MTRLDEPSQVLALLTDPDRSDATEPGLDLLFADADGEALEVVMPIDDLPVELSQAEREQALDGLLGAFATHGLMDGLALVVRRGGRPEPDVDDAGWQRAFAAACRTNGMTDHGVYVMTPRGAGRLEPISGS